MRTLLFAFLLLPALAAGAEESRGKLLLTYGLARGVPTALTEVALHENPRAMEGNPLMRSRSVRLSANAAAVLLLAEGTHAMAKKHPNRARWLKRVVVGLCVLDAGNNVLAARRR